MFSFNARGDALHFEFPEGQIDLNEVLQAVGQAGRMSLRDSLPIRVTISGVDTAGVVEARHTPGRVYPPVISDSTNIWFVPGEHGYDLLVSPTPSPYYRICIPGVIDSIDQNVLALAPDVWPRGLASRLILISTIYNLTLGAINIVYDRLDMPENWRIYPADYNNIRAYRDMLSKKPRVPKPVDFGPLLVKLFGEKIAAAIMKEIK